MKSLITYILLFGTYLTACGQYVDFVDTVFTKRLHNLNLQMELPYNDIVGNKIKTLTRQNVHYTAKSIGAFLAEREYIDSVLKVTRLPKELAYLPLALSQMNPYTENKYNCAGVWQLPYFVAINYGLQINSEVDERYDIKKSTSAAVSYLKKLSEKYTDLWDVIIAYSNSSAAIEAAKIRTNHSKDIWNLYDYGNLPNKNIIPDFITYTYLVNFYQSHHIQPIMPEEGKEMFPRNSVVNNTPAAPKPVNTSVAPKPVNTSVQTKPPVPNNNNVAKSVEKKKITYTVKSGDNLTKISRIYKVSIESIQKWNNLKNDRINIGQKLIIYQ